MTVDEMIARDKKQVQTLHKKGYMDIDQAFSHYSKTGVAPKGYYLDKNRYWKAYNSGLSSEDAKSSAFRMRKGLKRVGDY